MLETSTTSAPATSDLSPLFTPRGVAVIGASRSGTKLGSVMARSLSGFEGPVALVNSRNPDPDADLHPSVEAAVAALQRPIDLAVLCIPAAASAGAIREAAQAGVGAAVVCAGGFAEAGEQGAAHQRQLAAAARETGVRLLGPNTSGFIAPRRRLVTSFVPSAAELPAGSVAVVAASGGVNHALAFLLADAGIGVSLAVGLGNAVDITAPDVLDHLAGDEATSAVVLHIESVADGERLHESVRRLTATRPVVALVVGRNDVAEFAQSHTGALATSWRTTRAVLRQAGAVVVDDEREAVDAVTALAHGRLAPSPDPGVGIVTAQAGPGLLLLDALRGHGVGVPPLQEETIAALGSLLPPLTYQRNPVDTGRPSPDFPTVLDTVATDPGVDVIVTYALTEPDSIDLVSAVGTVTATTSIPTLVAVGGSPEEVRKTRDQLQRAGVAAYPAPTALATGAAALVEDARRAHLRDLPHEATTGSPLSGSSWDEHAAKEVVGRLGAPTPARRACDDDDAAHAALDDLGGPVVVKLLDSAVLHKTEVGGVHLNVRSHEELESALAALRASGAERFLVEAMAPVGVDLIVGAHRDPVFGPVVLLGLGGTQAEALADVALRRAPVSTAEAATMPDDLQGAALLDGWRGGPKLDRNALAELMRALGGQLAADPRVESIEINPLRLTDEGLLALDAVITTKEK